jgi:hypothetical protein
MKSEAVSTSGFKVRPLSKVVKPDEQAAGSSQQVGRGSIETCF